MRLNVGTGDKGLTSLLSGERVPKSHARVEAAGELDELASVLGALASVLPGVDPARAEIPAIQSELLTIGAWVASSPDSPVRRTIAPPAPAAVTRIEDAIERYEKGLPALQAFLLPGGSAAASWAHVARAVCRRAERRTAAVPCPEALPFLNRLSTYLYALARRCNHEQGIAEAVWKP